MKKTINTMPIAKLNSNLKIPTTKQLGFSLIELMIGLVIGLIGVLVILQVFSAFEGQKRTTTGTADAQTNGAIALYSMSREIQSAGYGLAVFDGATSPLNCPVNFAVDHDGVAGTSAIAISPITIVDGGLAGSDTVTVRYGNASGGGIPVPVNNIVSATVLGVPNNLGCVANDVAIAQLGATCVGARVDSLPSNIQIKLNSTNTMTIAHRLSCIGNWNEYAFSVNANQLQRKVSTAAAEPIVSDIVMIQAQYGISANVASNQISSWVNATGVWVTPSLNDRKLIKAVRVAVISRNSKIENEVVSFACSDIASAAPTGLCAWAGTAASNAPTVDLSGTVSWDRYRYRVYETVIPLRNMVWSLKSL